MRNKDLESESVQRRLPYGVGGKALTRTSTSLGIELTGIWLLSCLEWNLPFTPTLLVASLSQFVNCHWRVSIVHGKICDSTSIFSSFDLHALTPYKYRIYCIQPFLQRLDASRIMWKILCWNWWSCEFLTASRVRLKSHLGRGVMPHNSVPVT